MRFINIHLLAFCLFSISVFAADGDSLITSPQNYSFRPQLMVNLMSIGRGAGTFGIRKANKENAERLNYRFREFSLSGYLPVYEKKFKKRNGYPEQANLSLLVTGSFSSSRAFFSFTSTKPVLRLSAGIRAIYYTGNKGVWMFSFAPFLSEETSLLRNAVPRFFGNILYSRMVSESFSYRLGASYSYLFNGGTLLPLIGIRVGEYHKVFLNIQVPRDISVNWTINNHWQASVFSRISGGIYRFQVDQEISLFQNYKDKAVLYRTDILSGIMLSYSPNSNWYFSMNVGLATSRNLNIAFSNEFVPVKMHVVKNANVAPSPFLNFSMAIYFGKPTYSGAYNYLIEQKAANNSMDVGDFNLGANQLTNDMNRVGVRDINKRDLKKLNDRYLDVKDFLLDE